MMVESYYPSPIGLIKISYNERGIINIEFVDECNIDYNCTFFTEYNNKKLKIIYKLIYDQLNEYFTGNRKIFELPIIMNGTEFQLQVWRELLKIPYGETRTYKEIAQALGNKNAARAVGNANKNNPFALIIPCHRVIGTGKNINGYAYGLWRKKWLLKHENKYIKKIESEITII